MLNLSNNSLSKILSYLDWDSATNLRQTCKRMHRVSKFLVTITRWINNYTFFNYDFQSTYLLCHQCYGTNNTIVKTRLTYKIYKNELISYPLPYNGVEYWEKELTELGFVWYKLLTDRSIIGR